MGGGNSFKKILNLFFKPLCLYFDVNGVNKIDLPVLNPKFFLLILNMFVKSYDDKYFNNDKY